MKSSGLVSLGVAASGCLSSCSCSKTEQDFEITTQALSKPTPKKTQKKKKKIALDHLTEPIFHILTNLKFRTLRKIILGLLTGKNS